MTQRAEARTAPRSPEIAVVVPARNAAGSLARTLEALQRSDFRGRVETIVVDDASTDRTPDIARSLGARVVSTGVQCGPAGARNAGVEDTAAPLIAFTDADCEPCPSWLQVVARALEGADVVTGPVLPDPSMIVRPFDRTLRITQMSALFETANLGIKRSVFTEIGGFQPFTPDPTRRGLRPHPDQGHFGEDAVFGWRAKRQGARIVFRSDAVVHHAVVPRGPRGYIAEKWRLRYFPALLEEVPELRKTLPLRLFLSPRTLSFDLALVSLVAALRLGRPWLLAGCAYYARRHLRTTALWRRSIARENLALIAGDAVALMALVRGSAAAHQLLL